MELKKIGIMGGTFDPPHIGHLMLATAAAEALGLEKIIFLPTGNIPYKDSSNTSPVADRLRMTELAIDGNPLFDICEIEAKSPDYSYTCYTLEKLNMLYKPARLFFIVGADSLDYMDRWREPERIFRQCSVAAINREGYAAEEQEDKAQELKERFGADIRLITMPNIGISSTGIRQMVRDGKSIKYMVPDVVEDYIIKKELYSGRKND